MQFGDGLAHHSTGFGFHPGRRLGSGYHPDALACTVSGYHPGTRAGTVLLCSPQFQVSPGITLIYILLLGIDILCLDIGSGRRLGFGYHPDARACTVSGYHPDTRALTVLLCSPQSQVSPGMANFCSVLIIYFLFCSVLISYILTSAQVSTRSYMPDRISDLASGCLNC